MVNQIERNIATVVVALSILSLLTTSAGAAPIGTHAGVIDADLPDYPNLQEIVDPDGDGYWGEDYTDQLEIITEGKGGLADASEVCQLARGALHDVEVTWERENPSTYERAEYAIDILQDEACREFRDDLLRALWSEADYPEGFDCARAYTPTIGPARGMALLPFSVCYGFDQDRCDVYIRHLGAVCLDGINPDN